MKKIFFIIFIISFLIILPEASGEYVWTRIDKVRGGYFRSFCEDSLGNIYLSQSWRILKSNDDGYNWSDIYTIPSNEAV
ncbi:MAG: hypothetical protein N2319_05135 [Candidatus Kapabacteria bacterium]|nr:hypothetical protein [Candidatus Kapabacteria bacterium]